MKGYIVNLTIEGAGLVRDGSTEFICRPGDMLLFAPKVPHYYHIAPEADRWYHLRVYFFARTYWYEALNWQCRVEQIERFTLPADKVQEFTDIFLDVINRSHLSGQISRMLAVNFLEQLSCPPTGASASPKCS